MLRKDDRVCDETEIQDAINKRYPNDMSAFIYPFIDPFAGSRKGREPYQKFRNHRMGSVANRMKGRLMLSFTNPIVDILWSY